MRVLVISFFNSWITHLGTELEIAQRHLDNGDDVEFLGCDGCIEICDGNPWEYKPLCTACREKRHNGLQLLTPVPKQHSLGSYVSREMFSEEASHETVSDLESAKNFRHNGHDLGWGAVSSTIMQVRDPECRSAEAAEKLRKFSKSALLSYNCVAAFLREQPQFDRVYLFNGRFAPIRGAWRACQEFADVDIQIHERGSTQLKYELFGNSLPHSRTLWANRIQDAWKNASEVKERESIGGLFYEERRAGEGSMWKSYTSAQLQGKLPANWDASRTNVAIFNSSEDEFAGIGDEWKNPVYDRQSLGIARIVSECVDRYPNMHLYLRVHPNLTNVENADLTTLLNLESPNLTIIAPDSDVSTYALLDSCDKVLGFGTTVGIEATYWKKVSILAGHTFYDQLEAVHVATDHNHLMSLLGEDLEPCDKQNAIKYGYYLRTYGLPFKYWEPDGFEAGTYRGYPISETHLHPLKLKLILWLQDRGMDTRRFSLFLSIVDLPIRLIQATSDGFGRIKSLIQPTATESS